VLLPERDGVARAASGHLTPSLLARELEQLGRPEVPVYIYHMKPPHVEAIAEELAGLGGRLEMLHQGRTYTLGREGTTVAHDANEAGAGGTPPTGGPVGAEGRRRGCASAPGARGLWIICPGCREMIYRKEVERNQRVCPKCSHHFRIGALDRVRLLVDEGSFIPHDERLAPEDPLRFKDTRRYADRARDAGRKSGRTEAVLSGEGQSAVARCRSARLSSTSWAGAWAALPGSASPAPRSGPASGAPRSSSSPARAGEDAGGPLLADADGENRCRARAARQGPPALPLDPRRPDDWRVSASFAMLGTSSSPSRGRSSASPARG